MSDTVMPHKGSIPSFSQHQLAQLMRTGYKLTPATLAQRIFEGRWIPAPHLLYISTIITDAIYKGGQFIIVTMPPRHGKSEFLSVNTSIWHMETFPEKRIILASYGAELATEFALKVRDTFQDEDLHTLLSTRLRKDKQKIDNFKTTMGGGMISIGVGGSATGKGADLFLIDDYVKNAEEALSDTQKTKAWDWFLSTAFTRLEPNATIIVLATRWDKRDLIGMIFEKFDELAELGFEPPTVINLPALARPDDPLGREVGAPLWPERYDLKALMRIKAMLGTYWFESLYQQNPRASMAGMDLGKHLQYIDRGEMPHKTHLKTVRVWDMAGTEEGGDFTAGPLVHLEKETGKIFISDVVHVQKSPKKVEMIVEATADMDGAGVQIWIEQEPGSAGKHIVEHYQKEILQQYAVRGEKATGPVEVRASPFLAAVEDENVYAVRGKWNAPFVLELDGFPEGDHDDIIVACSLGYRRLLRGRFGGAIWGNRGRDRGGRRSHTSGRSTNARGTKRKILGVTW